MNRLFVGIALLLTLFLTYLAGYAIGFSKSNRENERKYYFLSKINSVLEYRSNVMMLENLLDNELGAVRCAIDLSASSAWREVKDCLNDDSCRGVISPFVEEDAPEILKDDRSRFRYFEHLEKCSHN